MYYSSDCLSNGYRSRLSNDCSGAGNECNASVMTVCTCTGNVCTSTAANRKFYSNGCTYTALEPVTNLSFNVHSGND